MRELKTNELKEVNGGFLPAAAGVVGGYLGMKFGSWLYTKFK